MKIFWICMLGFFLWASCLKGPVFAQEAVVDALAIKGNAIMSTSTLKALMVTRSKPWYGFLPLVKSRRFDIGVFAADLQRIRTYYQDHGYFSAKVDSVITRASNRVRVLLQIEEGPVTRIRRAEIVGWPDALPMVQETVRQRADQLIGQPLVRQEVAAAVNFMFHQLRERGYAFAKVGVDSQIVDVEADFTFAIESGPVCEIGAIQVLGNAHIATPTVLRGVTFRKGDLFNESDLRDSQRQLYRAGVFRSVTLGIPDSVVHESPVDVVLTVTERPFHSLKLGGGYDTEDHFRISADWAHRNFWGDARQVKVSGLLSGRAREVVLGVRQPYFFSSRNWLNVSGSILRHRQANFEQNEVGGNASLERNLWQSTNLVFQVSGGLIDFKADSAFTDFRTSFLTDTRNDIFDPQRGYLAQILVRERGRLFQSQAEFIQVTAEGRWFQPLPFNSVLGLRVQSGAIFELGNPGQVPSIERFFAGGMNSVRGWALDDLGPRAYSAQDSAFVAVGGLSKWVGSIELRTRWLSFLGTAIFLDVGKVGVKTGDLLPTNLGWAVGGGVRFMTPVGPLRFDLGYRLSDDVLRISDRLHYYISLGQAF